MINQDNYILACNIWKPDVYFTELKTNMFTLGIWPFKGLPAFKGVTPTSYYGVWHIFRGKYV